MAPVSELDFLADDVTAPSWELMSPETFEMGDKYDSCACDVACDCGCCQDINHCV